MQSLASCLYHMQTGDRTHDYAEYPRRSFSSVEGQVANLAAEERRAHLIARPSRAPAAVVAHARTDQHSDLPTTSPNPGAPVNLF
jgi:hypothetical protein